MSVLEIARIRSKPSRGDEFLGALQRGLAVQGADPECSAIHIQRGVEDPDDFLLNLVWTSIEAHNNWRAAHRDEWRAHISELMDGTPQLLGHYRVVDHVKKAS